MDLRSFRRLDPSLSMSQSDGETERETCMGALVFLSRFLLIKCFQTPTAEILCTCIES